MSMKNSSDIGNRTRDLPVSSAVHQPTAPPRIYYSNLYSSCQLLAPNQNRLSGRHISILYGSALTIMLGANNTAIGQHRQTDNYVI